MPPRLLLRALVSLVLIALGCGDNRPGHGDVLGLSTATIELAAGDSTMVTATGAAAAITWSSSDRAIVRVTPAGNGLVVVRALAEGTATITATAGTGDETERATATVTVSAAELRSIGVTPPRPRLAHGTTVQLTAIGVYSDATARDLTDQVAWSSSASATASVGAHGLVTAADPGTATVTAALGAITGTSSIEVTAATLVSLAITPPDPSITAGGTQQLTATGTFSDGTVQDLTSMVTWRADLSGHATVSAGGLVTAVAAGGAQITAALDTVTAYTTITVTAATLVSLEVTPAQPSLAKGLTLPFHATGTFSDTTTRDLTADVTWSATAGANISNASGSEGVATATAVGTTTITATLGAVTGSTDLDVTDAVLASIQITPIDPSAPAHFVVQFTAMGTFSDASTQDLTTAVTWSSSDPAVAAISNASDHGLATTFAAGPTTIEAALGAIHGETTLTVTATELTAIQVTPTDPSIAKGLTQAFTATGVFSDMTTLDITNLVVWTSDTTATATISNAAGSHGLATSVDAGTTTIAATLGAIAGQTTLVVTPATLVAIAITPADPTIAVGETVQFTATGTFSDATTSDLTATVTWDSSAATATISNAAGSQGLATGVGEGPSTITATLGSVAGSTTLTVGAAVLVSIEVTPANPDLPAGRTLQFTATGTYSDASQRDLTTQVTWGTSDAALAQISNAPGSEGLATALGIGTPSVTATSPDLGGGATIVGSTTLNVTAAELVSIAVAPAAFTVSQGNTVALVATGTFSDASTQNITSSVTWTSDATATATVTNTGTRGVVTGVAVGGTTIHATSGAIASTATATVVGLQVKAFTPSAGIEGVKTTTEIEVSFDHAIAPASLTVQAADGACSGTLQVSPDDFATCVGLGAQTMNAANTLASYPPVALAPATPYRIRVLAAVTSSAGPTMGSDVDQATAWRTASATCTSTLAISQLYGGGGNSGAVYTNDFVELHNRGQVDETLAGTALQYASATGSSWGVVALPDVTIPPGGYYLVQLAAGNGNGVALPTPDFASTVINMSGTSGKIALTASSVALTGTCPLERSLDFVGFGTANCAETTATAALTNATAGVRNTDGCTDTDDNSADFTIAAPTPRNAATAPTLCTACE